MPAILSLLVLVAAFAVEPMNLEIVRGGDTLVLSFSLNRELPESLEETLSSGATAELDYPLRVYGRRRMFPDRKVWKGVARVTVNSRRRHRQIPVPAHRQRRHHRQPRGAVG